ncbi:MAG: serine hydrolase domain-containing protein [Ilumatobacteraceae bacterium]|jgi:CubicO group peptidase (beta-lactamase class C family)
MSVASLRNLVGDLMTRPEQEGVTLAVLVALEGRVLAEAWGRHPATTFAPARLVSPDDTLISWSMAKSITHALVGIAVEEGLVPLDRPAAVPEWRGTPAEAITLLDLLEMRSGLAFVEDYVDGEGSDCIHMLFSGDGARGVDDMGAYAASRPVLHPPGTAWSYSSGTTNIITRLLGDAVAGGDVATVGPRRRSEAMTTFVRERLFGPAGMSSASARFDASGTFIGSSFVYATAADFLRFGEVYRRDGVAADGRRVVPAGWRDHARTFVAHDADGAGPGGFDYGRHWWMWPRLPGSLAAHGYQGQFTLVVPDTGVTLVHLGVTDVAVAPGLVERLEGIVSVASEML